MSAKNWPRETPECSGAKWPDFHRNGWQIAPMIARLDRYLRPAARVGLRRGAGQGRIAAARDPIGIADIQRLGGVGTTGFRH